MKELKIGDTYWLGSFHTVDKRTWTNSDSDRWCFNSGYVFKSKDEAQKSYDKERARLNEIRSKIKEPTFIALVPGEKLQ